MRSPRMAIRALTVLLAPDDSRSRPEVLDYLHAENDYGRKVMASQQALQDQLLNEMVQRIPQRCLRTWTKNGYRYRHIYEPGNEYPIYSVSRC